MDDNLCAQNKNDYRCTMNKRSEVYIYTKYMDMKNLIYIYICRLQGNKSIKHLPRKMDYLLYVHEIKFKHEYKIWT